MITLKDIASVCGVSVATVSRALNGSGDISPAQVERIRRTAAQMGYLPNAAARALKTNRSFMLGILYEDRMDHEYFSLVIEGIRHRAEERGFDLAFLSHNTQDGNAEYPEHAARRNLDGVVLVSCRWQETGVQRILAGPLPCIVIDYAQKGCDTVANDNLGSMKQLVREAYARGYRRLAFIHGEAGYVTDERLAGFEAGLQECGLIKRPEYIRSARFRHAASSWREAKALTELSVPPDCVFFPDDFSLMGVMDQLRQRGLCLRDCFAAVGYDGIGPSSYFYPRLFTYRQDTETIGRLAVDRLLDRILGQAETWEPGEVIVPGTMLQGDTLPPKATLG